MRHRRMKSFWRESSNRSTVLWMVSSFMTPGDFSVSPAVLPVAPDGAVPDDEPWAEDCWPGAVDAVDEGAELLSLLPSPEAWAADPAAAAELAAVPLVVKMSRAAASRAQMPKAYTSLGVPGALTPSRRREFCL